MTSVPTQGSSCQESQDQAQLLELGLGPVQPTGAERKTCPVHKGAEESLEYCTADVFRVNTVGLEDTLEEEIIPQLPMTKPHTGELL